MSYNVFERNAQETSKSDLGGKFVQVAMAHEGKMPILSIAELYQSIEDPSNYTQENRIAFIQTLTDKDKNELSRFELARMHNNESTLLEYFIRKCPHSTKDKKWPQFELYLQVIKHLLSLLSDEILNTECSTVVEKILGKTYTSLTLAIECFIELYKNLPTEQVDLDHHINMINKWKLEIIDFLLIKGISPDKGMVFGRSILTAIIAYIDGSPAYSAFISLYVDILPKVKEINRRGSGLNLMSTALSVAISRLFPIEFIEKLLDKNADVNLLYCRTLTNHIQLPLLCFIIEQKNYALLKLFLMRGANPNKMPECDGFILERYLQDAYLLTPYQLAVSRNDHEAVNIIVAHAKEQGIVLNTELHEKEKSRLMGRLKLSVKDTELSIKCQSNLFNSQDNLLQNIQTRFGIKVFVKNADEKQVTTESMIWLLDAAKKSSARYFWQPILECLNKELNQNKEFAIYVSEIPQKTTENLGCAGLFHKDIHLQMDLPKKLQIWTIAHELGHLFHHRKFPLDGLSSANNADNIRKFKEAVISDLAGMNKDSCLPLIAMRLNDIATLYDDNKKFSDYFTVIFVELPIALAFENPEYCEEDIFKIMLTHFPATMNFYQKHINKNDLINLNSSSVEMRC